MFKFIKNLFSCKYGWHNYKQVEGNDWYIKEMCRNCGKSFIVENY